MSAARPILGLISLILVAAGVLFQFFIILSGAVQGNPEPHFFFLQADTAGMGNGMAPSMSAWTYFAVCSIANGKYYDCGKVKAALPFSPVENFGGTMAIPPAFIGSHHYYYLSRFAWAFYIIALFFGVVALFTGLLALCTRLGSYLSGATTLCALFFQTLAAALMTAWTVQARNAFRAAGRTASLGRYSYGFTWATVFAFFVATILFCVGGSVGGGDRAYKRSRFGRKQSTRSRGSFAAHDKETELSV